MKNYEWKLGVLVATLLLAAPACKPNYPDCETDNDCKEHKEFCVARKCQQCRTSNDCGEGRECGNGKCNAIVGFCKDNTQCPAGQICFANRCSSCQSDMQCPAGQICDYGRCSKAQCAKDEDCPQDKDCKAGRCVGSDKVKVEGPPCPLETVYFGFNISTLTSDGRNALSKNAACLKKTGRGIDLVGHADPRGTTEYNMALSDRRAQAVRDYLRQAGIDSTRLKPVPRGNLDATGTDESSWAKDRRVDSEWK
jgi:peptidoglycan-associated lipoprotein